MPSWGYVRAASSAPGVTTDQNERRREPHTAAVAVNTTRQRPFGEVHDRPADRQAHARPQEVVDPLDANSNRTKVQYPTAETLT